MSTISIIGLGTMAAAVGGLSTPEQKYITASE